MRLLLLAVSAAVLQVICGLQLPPQCEYGTGDELEYTCQVEADVKVTFNARINDYVNMKCLGTTFSCASLPVINFANNLTLPHLALIDCSPSTLRCINRALQTTSVTSVVIINGTEPVLPEDVRGLGDVRAFMLKPGADKIAPVTALKNLPMLTDLRVHDSHLQLHSDGFLESPPLTYLELSVDRITEVPANAFYGLSKLKTLNVWGNNFTDIVVDALKGLDSLETLNLNTNHLSTIAAGSLIHTPKLKSLTLLGNELKELPFGLIHSLPLLENVTIQYNRVELKVKQLSLSNLPSLKNLRLESSQITALPDDLLKGNEALQTLSLSENHIKSLPPTIFRDLKALEKLDLSFNRIKYVTVGTFASLRQLKSLNLNRNHIEMLPDSLFSGLLNLKYVSIDHNSLTTIYPSAFQGALGLETLSLVANKLNLRPQDLYTNIEDVYFYSPFSFLTNLRKLILSGNDINNIYSDWRNVLLHLEELDLSWNRFQKLDMYDVQFLSSNVTVDLRHNKINSLQLDPTISPYGAESQKSSILIDNNPLTCDCGTYLLAMRLRGLKPLTAEPKFIVGNVRCASPPRLQGQLFKNVSPSDLNCDLPEEDCHHTCLTCQLRPAKKEVDLNCDTIPLLPDPEQFGAEFISLKLQIAPQYIGNLSVQTLNLTNIGLEEIPFAPSNSIKAIDFSNNKLTMIPMEFLESNTSLYLSNNPFECECWNAEQISALKNSVFVKDLDRLTCQNGRILKEVDVIALCSTWRAAAVASATFIILVLLVTIAGVTVYKYRNEIFVYISTRKILSRFFTEYDMKKYDVFISYAHKDKVYFDELLPKLEVGFGQKTCVHYRDWNVGDLIPEQINESVKNSRRTLVLLSRNFIESTFTNMEFRTAHNYALKEGKTRVILILLEDITKHENLTEELKAYISTNTYLTWDDPRFFERLQRALPKRTKKFIWPDVFKQAGEETIKAGLNVHLNSDGKLVNIAAKDMV